MMRALRLKRGTSQELSFPMAVFCQAADAALNFSRHCMNQIIYLVGLIVVIMFILSLLGLR
jgi:hypothetical protein